MSHIIHTYQNFIHTSCIKKIFQVHDKSAIIIKNAFFYILPIIFLIIHFYIIQVCTRDSSNIDERSAQQRRYS